jgi:hypothetical protein
MNNKYMFIVAAMAVTLVGTTALATSESVFASDENQAVSQANACGNGELPLNVGCQNIDSQIQGDENEIAIAGVQSFPGIPLPGPGPEPLK